MLPEQLSAVATFGLLSLSVAALWVRISGHLFARIGFWSIPFVLSLGFAFEAGFVTPRGVAFIVLFGLASWLYTHYQQVPLIRWFTGIVILLVALGFTVHVLPGFSSYTAIPEAVLSPGAIPYARYLTYDKPLIGLFLLSFCHPLVSRSTDWKRMLRVAMLWFLITATILLGSAFALDYVRFDPKLPAQFPLWAWSNLFFTCIPEEALFRAFIQQHLDKGFAKIRFGGLYAIVLASLMFGLAHFKGGISYVMLATVAGVGYGFVYQKTKRVESSILVHFAVNTIHFLFFTYPALRH